jgi:hypothetical protein
MEKYRITSPSSINKTTSCPLMFNALPNGKAKRPIVRLLTFSSHLTHRPLVSGPGGETYICLSSERFRAIARD